MTLPDPNVVYREELDESLGALSLTGYGELTTANEVRAILGVSEVEVPDEMLQQPVYAIDIVEALDALMAKSTDGWWTILGSPDPKSMKIVTATKRWAAYAYADRICDVLKVVVARSMTDSKASFQRFDTDLDSVINNIRHRFAMATKSLQSAIDEAHTSVFTKVSYVSDKQPEYDPVTGVGYETLRRN